MTRIFNIRKRELKVLGHIMKKEVLEKLYSQERLKARLAQENIA